MARIRIVTAIDAPIECCFDLARDIDFHMRTQSASGERAIAGRTSGLIELGETVTWEARHLGLRRRHTSRITRFERPGYFQDAMTAGSFRSFVHDHQFERIDGRTVMTDAIEFRSPYGLLGRLVDAVYLAGYLRRLLAARADQIRREAERLSRVGP